MSNNLAEIFNFKLIDEKYYCVSPIRFEFCLKKVVIPEYYNSLPVKAVEGFDHLQTIEEVVLPSTLESINDDAFHRCENLKRINIPDSVQYIGDHAFYFCLNLSDIKLPSSLKHIGTCCFQRCEKFSKMEIPHSVTSFGGNVFLSCTNLKEIYISNPVFNSERDTFDSKFLEKIYFKMSFEDFMKCRLSYSKTIFKKAFVLKNGRYVNVGIDLYEITEEKVYVDCDIADERFYSNMYVKEIVLGPNVHRIGNRAFTFCKNLEKCVFSSGLKEIGSSAFYGTSLSSVEIPDSVSSIGEKAFGGISKLEYISFPKILDKFSSWIPFCKQSIKVIWPQRVLNGIDLIPNFAGYCLETLTIPEGITEIRENFITNNSYIKKIIFPKTLRLINSCAFSKLPNLETIDLNNNQTLVAYNAFYKCDKLIFNKKDISAKSSHPNFNVMKTCEFGGKELEDTIGSDVVFYNVFKKYFDEFDSIESLIEYLLKQKRTSLISEVTIDDAIHFDDSGVTCSIPECDIRYVLSKSEEKASIDNFTNDNCKGLVFVYPYRPQITLAILKVEKIKKENLWVDYFDDNEEIHLAKYIIGNKNNLYLLLYDVPDLG